MRGSRTASRQVTSLHRGPTSRCSSTSPPAPPRCRRWCRETMPTPMRTRSPGATGWISARRTSTGRCPTPGGRRPRGAWSIPPGRWARPRCSTTATRASTPMLHLQLIGRLGVTTFCAPPTVYRLFAQIDLGRYELGSLRHCLSAGEPLNPEAMRVWREATGTEVHDGYGQTETINVVANFPCLPVRPGSMGKPVPGFDVGVVDDEGRPVPAGTDRPHRASHRRPASPPASSAATTKTRRGRPPRSGTAGTTPATPRPATRTATSGSWDGPTTSSARQATASAPSRWRARLPSTPQSSNPRWWAHPTPCAVKW